MPPKTLIVLLGPTGVGKTELSLQLAEHFGVPILNADSRQVFRDMPIGTAAPTPEQLARVRHYFVAMLAPGEYYSAARFEQDALQVLRNHFQDHSAALLSGGSMLYIDAVCDGIDDIPTVSDSVREHLRHKLQQEGLAPLRRELQAADPEYYAHTDLQNPRRIVHALEIFLTSGRPYSSFLHQEKPARPFRILKIGLRRDRSELFDRINRRVDQMMADGLLEEARRLLPLRHTNALRTVGYNELFRHLDGEWPLEMAVERIKKNTRVYAKKQMTWFQRDARIHWFHPDQIGEIMRFVEENTDSVI